VNPNPKFLKKSKFSLPFPAAGHLHRTDTELAGSGKKPVMYGTGQGRFDGAVRTGGGSEPVGPAGFTGSVLLINYSEL
jgi:hypothetical protein